MIAAIPAPLQEQLAYQFSQVIGFIYPNEVEMQWSILIVIYPYITGIGAGLTPRKRLTVTINRATMSRRGSC